jgi:hypothetical protein
MGKTRDKGYAHGTPLKEFGIFRSYLVTLTHRRTIAALAPYLWTVLKDFFFLQFSVKWGWRKIPIVSVDHPLDALVPFREDKALMYLDFINFWVRSLSMLLKKLGIRRGLPYAAEYFSCLAKTYHEAAKVYRYRMTTTVRPASDDRLIKAIRRCDPHFLCVPSLHIAIVVFTHDFYRVLMEKEAAFFSPGEAERYERELYQGALAIAETVLYVKQHSVNCIPAALYMICRLYPGLCTLAGAADFIDRLFIEAKDVPPEAGAEIHSHIQFIFERFILEGFYSDDWEEPVKRWVAEYQK